MKLIEFFLIIDKKISRNKKFNFRMSKTDKINLRGHEGMIKVKIHVPDSFFNKASFEVEIKALENKAEGNVNKIEELEEELNRIKQME